MPWKEGRRGMVIVVKERGRKKPNFSGSSNLKGGQGRKGLMLKKKRCYNRRGRVRKKEGEGGVGGVSSGNADIEAIKKTDSQSELRPFSLCSSPQVSGGKVRGKGPLQLHLDSVVMRERSGNRGGDLGCTLCAYCLVERIYKG